VIQFTPDLHLIADDLHLIYTESDANRPPHREIEGMREHLRTMGMRGGGGDGAGDGPGAAYS
jgi:hypothetical protein